MPTIPFPTFPKTNIMNRLGSACPTESLKCLNSRVEQPGTCTVASFPRTSDVLPKRGQWLAQVCMSQKQRNGSRAWENGCQGQAPGQGFTQTAHCPLGIPPPPVPIDSIGAGGVRTFLGYVIDSQQLRPLTRMCCPPQHPICCLPGQCGATLGCVASSPSFAPCIWSRVRPSTASARSRGRLLHLQFHHLHWLRH